jgi:hypothetical protein
MGLLSYSPALAHTTRIPFSFMNLLLYVFIISSPSSLALSIYFRVHFGVCIFMDESQVRDFMSIVFPSPLSMPRLDGFKASRDQKNKFSTARRHWRIF